MPLLWLGHLVGELGLSPPTRRCMRCCRIQILLLVGEGVVVVESSGTCEWARVMRVCE